MPLSAAEKQRRYRQRRDADQARRAKYLEKEKERYRQLKETGKRKTKNEMTARELRLNRKIWRLHKRDIRKRKKEVQTILTPPGSPQQIGEPATQLADVAENQTGPSKQISASRRKRQREKAYELSFMVSVCCNP